MMNLTCGVDRKIVSFGVSVVFLELELVGDFGCDLLESDGGAGDAFEPDPVE